MARPHESNWLLRLPERVHRLLVVSRSLTDIAPELWLFVRSGAIKRALSSSFANFHSSALSVRLPRISRPTSDSRDLLSLPFRRLPKLTWLVCLRIQTCVPSMPRGSPLCLRMFNWHDASVGNGHNDHFSFRSLYSANHCTTRSHSPPCPKDPRSLGRPGSFLQERSSLRSEDLDRDRNSLGCK